MDRKRKGPPRSGSKSGRRLAASILVAILSLAAVGYMSVRTFLLRGEFYELDFSILRRIVMERNLMEAIMNRMKGDGTHIHDNLEIILWALENENIEYQRVEEFLLLIDINSARLPIPSELRYSSVARTGADTLQNVCERAWCRCVHSPAESSDCFAIRRWSCCSAPVR